MKPKKPQPPPLERQEKFVKVGMIPTGVKPWDSRGPKELPEDWAPNCAGDKVRVRFGSYRLKYPYDPEETPKWHVSVWGDDDLGMEFVTEDRAEALWRYEAIGDGVTRDALKEAGFKYC